MFSSTSNVPCPKCNGNAWERVSSAEIEGERIVSNLEHCNECSYDKLRLLHKDRVFYEVVEDGGRKSNP